MDFRRLALIAGVAAGGLGLFTMAARAEQPAGAFVKVTGPHVSQNLAVYFLRGKSSPGPVPLTLGEGLAKGAVTVHETGQVENLLIENSGSEPVFIQAGDIVKGGRQDRVLTISLLLPPKSGRMPIGSYCVEQGRWSRRGIENALQFSSSENALPSRGAKLAILDARPRVHASPPYPRVDTQSAAARMAAEATGGAQRSDDRLQPFQMRQVLRSARPARAPSAQSEVWASVADIQRKLAANLGASVASERSRSSLQLSLENKKLADAQASMLSALEALAEDEDVIGYAFAINGKLNSAEIYPSNGLFRKMWPKLIRASITEAISEQDADAKQPARHPSVDDVTAFLAAAEKGKAESQTLTARVTREARRGEKTFSLSTRLGDGSLIHRSILAH